MARALASASFYVYRASTMLGRVDDLQRRIGASSNGYRRCYARGQRFPLLYHRSALLPPTERRATNYQRLKSTTPKRTNGISWSGCHAAPSRPVPRRKPTEGCIRQPSKGRPGRARTARTVETGGGQTNVRAVTFTTGEISLGFVDHLIARPPTKMQRPCWILINALPGGVR